MCLDTVGHPPTENAELHARLKLFEGHVGRLVGDAVWPILLPTPYGLRLMAYALWPMPYGLRLMVYALWPTP